MLEKPLKKLISMIIKIPNIRLSSHREIYKWIQYFGSIDSEFLNELKQEITIFIKNDGAEILPKFTGYINSGDSLNNGNYSDRVLLK